MNRIYIKCRNIGAKKCIHPMIGIRKIVLTNNTVRNEGTVNCRTSQENVFCAN